LGKPKFDRKKETENKTKQQKGRCQVDIASTHVIAGKNQKMDDSHLILILQVGLLGFFFVLAPMPKVFC
jgi:hypothetical protein